MRFSLALVLPCAISVIAQPILGDNCDAVATTTGLASPEIARSVETAEAVEHHEGEKIHWPGVDDKDCSGVIGKKDDIIHIKRKHGPGHPNEKDKVKVGKCLYGLAVTAEHRVYIQPYLKKTLDYYENYWPNKPSSSMQNDKRDEHAVQGEQAGEQIHGGNEIDGVQDGHAIDSIDTVHVTEAAEGVQGKGRRFSWKGDQGQACSGRLRNGIVHIKRKHGRGHPNKKDGSNVWSCLQGFRQAAEAGNEEFADLLTHTMDYYIYEWA